MSYAYAARSTATSVTGQVAIAGETSVLLYDQNLSLVSTLSYSGYIPMRLCWAMEGFLFVLWGNNTTKDVSLRKYSYTGSVQWTTSVATVNAGHTIRWAGWGAQEGYLGVKNGIAIAFIANLLATSDRRSFAVNARTGGLFGSTATHSGIASYGQYLNCTYEQDTGYRFGQEKLRLYPPSLSSATWTTTEEIYETFSGSGNYVGVLVPGSDGATYWGGCGAVGSTNYGKLYKINSSGSAVASKTKTSTQAMGFLVSGGIGPDGNLWLGSANVRTSSPGTAILSGLNDSATDDKNIFCVNPTTLAAVRTYQYGALYGNASTTKVVIGAVVPSTDDSILVFCCSYTPTTYSAHKVVKMRDVTFAVEATADVSAHISDYGPVDIGAANGTCPFRRLICVNLGDRDSEY